MPRQAKKQVLVLNICKEKLHYYEFVKPIEDTLEKVGIEFYTKHYTKFTDKDLKANRIIICGTSLKDKDYLENLNLFKWIDFYKKPILGICGGMQIISNHFKGDLVEKQEIGLNKVKFSKEFLGVKGKIEVYQLHNFSVKPNGDYFEIIALSGNKKIVQAIKHKEGPIYGAMFHPEVRNKKLIESFSKLTD